MADREGWGTAGNGSWLCLDWGASALWHLIENQKGAFLKPSMQVGPARLLPWYGRVS